jgi:Recombinase
VWGRTRQYLGNKTERVPRDKWIICEKTYEPIISAELFEKAQMALAGLTRHLSDDEMIERLRKIWQAEGRLTGKNIERSPICPCLSTYYHRFGGILQAYKRVGYPHGGGDSAKRLDYS